jgi:hypothetical protein
VAKKRGLQPDRLLLAEVVRILGPYLVRADDVPGGIKLVDFLEPGTIREWPAVVAPTGLKKWVSRIKALWK